jgi:hypothetical protein
VSATQTETAQIAVRSAAERLAAANAELDARLRGSTLGQGPVSEHEFHAVETAWQSAQEYVRALARLRDVLRDRLRL